MKDILKKVFFGFIILFSFCSCGYGAELLKELPTIIRAAKRNDCVGDNFLLLCSIRLAENGGEGREFGILHPDAIDTNLDVQAGWCAATIMANHDRFDYHKVDDHFIEMLGERYCPPEIHPLNQHWQTNVKYFYDKFKDAE